VKDLCDEFSDVDSIRSIRGSDKKTHAGCVKSGKGKETGGHGEDGTAPAAVC
jgi:hypothetical protein